MASRCEGHMEHLEKANGVEISNRTGFWLFAVIAMNGGTPCAAALYTNPYTDYEDYVDNMAQNSFVLSKIIRNVGDSCRGSGAAIMCYLIQNSINKEQQFRPLKVESILDQPKLKSYFESFGCKPAQKSWWNILDNYLYCNDRKPKKCDQYVNKAFDAESYFYGEDK